MLKRTALIDMMLSLGFQIIGHCSTIDYIQKHMNFSNGNIRVDLTDDNNHIFCIRSAHEHLAGGYDGRYISEQIIVNSKLIKVLEPFLLPKESIVIDIENWKYKPYEDRKREEIRQHNAYCQKYGLQHLMI